jgi:hypothetical protein
MILRVLLSPPEDAGGAGGRGDKIAPGVAGPAATAAPHLLQNLVPGARAAPQELQNAISYLVDGGDSARRASIPQIGSAAKATADFRAGTSRLRARPFKPGRVRSLLRTTTGAKAQGIRSHYAALKGRSSTSCSSAGRASAMRAPQSAFLQAAFLQAALPQCALHNLRFYNLRFYKPRFHKPRLRKTLAPEAGAVVGHGECQENEEEEDGGDDD